MASREMTLFLKYPGSNIALQRLQHSFLDCVVEHKSGTIEELQACPPSYLKSDYQLRGTATLEDDELVITFTPKHSGLHTVRIFADTRELCKPVAFIVNQNSEIESTPIDKPIRPSSSLFRQVAPSPAPSSTTQSLPYQQRMSQPIGTQAPQRMQPANVVATGWEYSPPAHLHQQQQQQHQQQQQQQQQQQRLQSLDDSNVQGFMSNPTVRNDVGGGERISHVSSMGGSRPTSMIQAHNEQVFAGDLISMTAEKRSFNELHNRRTAGESGAHVGRNFMMMDYSKAVTPETFDILNKDVSQMVGSRGIKTRRRCSVCSKKVKIAKLLYLGDHDFCESCFKRQYAMRSAIDHFLVPIVQDCAVDVPINKKGTKFITARKTIPDVNLRGLEPGEVRYAQDEFKKFNMDDSGWIGKAVLFPLLKACFAAHLKDQEIRHLLSGKGFKSLITSYGIDLREEVHELEFLSLLAFIAREAISLKGVGMSKAKKFSAHDLEMAYAFHSKFGQGSQNRDPPQPRGISVPPSSNLANFGGGHQVSPTHISPAPHHRLDTSPQHASNALGRSMQHDVNIPGHSPMQALGHGPGQGKFAAQMSQQGHTGYGESFGGQYPQKQSFEETGQVLSQSAGYSGQGMQFGGSPVGQMQQERDEQRMSMLLAAANASNERHASRQATSPPDHERKMSSTMQLYPTSGQLHPIAATDMLDASRNSAFSEPFTGPPLATSGLQDLPEEDRDELPVLPPNKDPLKHTISLQKKQTNSKRIMHDLKLTGESADSWMMY